MNTDPAYPLIDRYLDGLATEKEAAALGEAVEADPDMLAALCDAATIEASLRQHLATPEQRHAMAPRIVPMWHWRRAGKWIAASTAAAVLAVSAAIHFWPAKTGGIGRQTLELVSGMTVKRFAGGAPGGVAPAGLPTAVKNAGPMEEVEFPVNAQWLTEMSNARPIGGGDVDWPSPKSLAAVSEIPVERLSSFLSGFAAGKAAGKSLAAVSEIPVEGAAGQMFSFSTKFADIMFSEDRARTDDYLIWYLRACGVTFPPGASAHWLRGRNGFISVNTSENIERITRVQQNPATMGAKQLWVSSQLWRIPAGTVAPALLQEERILSAGEVNMLQRIGHAQDSEIRSSLALPLVAPSESQCRFLLRTFDDTDFLGNSGPPSPWDKIHAHVQLNQWRVGDHIVVSGLAGPRPGDKPLPSPPGVQNAEMEFELTLASGEAAVLHLGRKSDGIDWILVVSARIGGTLDPLQAKPPPAAAAATRSIGGTLDPLQAKPTITLGNIPNVMKFDQKILTIKAGSPVRLLHKNDACALMHNFVLVKPGTAAAVGALADEMLRDPDALAKLYIPVSPDILVTGTRLLKRGESEEILFTAPAEPGDYPYLCTFPGHWRLQQGILRVVR